METWVGFTVSPIQLTVFPSSRISARRTVLSAIAWGTARAVSAPGLLAPARELRRILGKRNARAIVRTDLRIFPADCIVCVTIHSNVRIFTQAYETVHLV